jgi:hypothetical protein
MSMLKQEETVFPAPVGLKNRKTLFPQVRRIVAFAKPEDRILNNNNCQYQVAVEGI